MNGAELLNNQIDKAADLWRKNKFDECLKIIEPEVQKLEAEKGPGGLFDDEKNEYYSNSVLFERALIRHYKTAKRQILFTDVDYAYMFYTYALVLYDFKRFDEAKIALEKAMRWNPVNVNIATEYAMIFKKFDDHERAFEESKKALKFAYTPEKLAKCYYHISTYFIDTGLYPEAIECLSLTLHYQRDYNNAFGALDYVERKMGKKVQLSLENIEAIAKKYGFSCYVNEDIVTIAMRNATWAVKMGLFDGAKQNLEIASYWCKSREVNELWDCVSAELNKGRPDVILSLKDKIETWKNSKPQKQTENEEFFLDKVNQVFQSESIKQKLKETIIKTREEVSKKNFAKALSIIEPCVMEVEEWLTACKPYDNTAEKAFFNFREPFESVLYEKLFTPVQKEFDDPGYPFGIMYMTYGGILIDLKRYGDAAVALRKGMRWDPINADLALEYAATFQSRRMYYEFFEITKDVFKIAFRKESIARCYRNLGFCFSEREMWSEAVCCYRMSRYYVNDSEHALRELDYIAHKTNGADLPNTNIEDVFALAEKYDFPVGDTLNVFDLAYDYGKHFFEEKQWNAAQYYLGIASEIRKDNDVNKMLGKIAEMKKHVN